MEVRMMNEKRSSDLILSSPAYQYCKKAIRKKETPKYVKAQMRAWMNIAEDKDKKYKISEKKYKIVVALLKILIMPKGLRAGCSLFECSAQYQWLTYVAIICTVERANPQKRKYETLILEICRKNFKTYTVATLFILLFFTEPQFSRFFSVAPDGSLSREIREAIAETIKSSPIIREFNGKQRFKILRDYIYCNTTDIKFENLAYSTSRMDGRLPNVFICDECGALPNSYPIQAMRSGQLNILNKLGCIISTKYNTIQNPFEDEVSYSKKVLDGFIDDETRFSLLYEPDEPKNWMNDDLILKQSNPVALEIKEIWDDLLKKRAYAIAVESARENFCCKHCNIIYTGSGTETYVDISALQACKKSEISWENRIVYVGLDLSESGDNTSVSIVSVDDNDHILADSYAFIPEGRIEEKMSSEHVNYRELLKTGKVIACGDSVIDYAVVEDFIMNIEKTMGVKIQAIGYDRWNALSTAQKLERAGFCTIEIRQTSSIMHPPAKLLKEKILKGEFEYTKNDLYEINFQNARCTFDTNKNMYVNKKKSTGKIDMVVSTINAVYLAQQDYFLNQSDFTIQVL
jgi:phage terminase large subunit-like protein